LDFLNGLLDVLDEAVLQSILLLCVVGSRLCVL